ncbi:MAG: COR domain-containing protein [Cyanobacteria bacterium J06634_5]
MTQDELLKLIDEAAADGWPTLDLTRRGLSELPPEIGQLTSLAYLDLSYNQLTTLPESVRQLTSLTSLNLRANQLTTLPESVGQLTSLTSLDLSSNQLTTLPESVGQLTSLTSLDLRANQLTTLPESVGQLTSLTTLYLSSNQLTTLPESVGQLTNLTTLYLSSNQLTTLPESAGQLTSLTTLYLRYNQLTTLPNCFQVFKRLETLDLRGNPLPIPPEILGPKEIYMGSSSASKTIDFYFSLQKETGSVPLYEAKLILVGEGGAGKTSLAKKIDDDDYPLPKDEKTTEGIDVIRWEFPLANGNTFRVNIWDFGGQEIYHATHQFFLTKRSLYLLVADDRRENTDFYYWLKIVELLSDSSPVLVIKNEKQDRQCEIDEGLFKSQFNNLKDYYPTNLEDNRGLQKIKDAIQFHISQLPHIGNPLPKIWVRVRSTLENYAQNCNTITLDTYFSICRQNGFTDKAKMLSLSSYLHDLGVCLHFQDDKLLKRTVILRPEWATTAVYKVADSDTVRENKGRFTEADAAEIWIDSDYSDLCDELLQLMMRFKLAYELPNKPGHYIAPQLLPINRPQYDWDTNDNLVLRYHYDFMPKGILTRFIVETHPLIEHQDRVWKNGVVLKDNWAQAEITENYPKNEINVKVSGSNKKPLLEKVRYELWKIHQSYERLQYQELIPCNCTKCKTNLDPERYDYTLLAQFITDKNYSIQCRKSYQSIDVRHLMSDILSESLATPEEKLFRETEIDGEMAAFQQQRALAYGPTYIDQSRTTNLTLQDATGSQLIVGDDNTLSKTNSPSNSTLPPNTVSLAQDLKALLEDFSEDFRPDTERGQTKIKDAVITELQQKPTLKARTAKALKAAGEQTLIEAVNHPVAKVVIKGIKGFLEG